VYYKRYIRSYLSSLTLLHLLIYLSGLAPYIPPIDPSNASDTQNFDDTFLDMEPVIDDGNDADHTDTDQERGEHTDTDRTDGEESNATPSQSRSSSVRPHRDNDSVDVFDGYSFKGRHSVIIDDEEEEEESGEEDEDEDIVSGRDVVLEPTQDTLMSVEGQTEEPKTPEARTPSLPELAPGTDISPDDTPMLEDILPLQPDVSTPRQEEEPSKELEAPYEKPPAPEPKESKGAKPPLPPPKTTGLRPSAIRTSHGRREKSGVAALDRYLSDTIDEDTEATEREDEDDDWDFIEAGDGEDRNGAKGTTLFARGVVDRYRLAVFGKSTTPSQRSTPRSFSGASKDSEGGAAEVAESPSPSGKLKRGRNPGLTFRKNPRQFLRPKTPPTYSRKSSGKTAVKPSASNVLSASTTSSPGLLTPAPSLGGTLRSKMSTTSVGYSSDQSVNGDADNTANADTVKGASAVLSEPEKPKNKKLVKKYKEGAEKMFSLFASPRQS
jgi:serum/glucocorticoid-regulated kinase 2